MTSRIMTAALAATLLVPPLPVAGPDAGDRRWQPAGPLRLDTTGRTFLLLEPACVDPRGGGRAIEVIGDLATADRIVVLVPGVDTTVADWDRGLGGVARRAPSVQARTVFDAINARAGASPAARVAVIAWLGYDPPDGLGLAALRAGRARAGATALTGFVADLAARHSAATMVLVGHSYGTVVLGLAAPALPSLVTDLVMLASPGAGVSDRAELGSSARLWAARAESDWIGNVPHVRLAGFGHGADPTAADFGATVLPTDGVTGHDGYLVEGAATLDALVDIVLA
jgi:pimeloyl-ACP methyl ester carboxylesterase